MHRGALGQRRADPGAGDLPFPALTAKLAGHLDGEQGMHLLGFGPRLLASEVADDVVGRALEVAESVAQAAPIAIRLTKAGLAQGSRGGFEVALQWEALAQPVTMATADIHKGIQARREQRPPTFDGS